VNEIGFPLLGAAFVAAILLPLSALLAKAGLILLERDEAGGPLHGFNLRYLLLTGSSALPVAWLISAGLHQSESGVVALVCLFRHATDICLEPATFTALLSVGAGGCWVHSLSQRASARVARTPQARRTLQRLEALVAAHPALSHLAGRLRVTEMPGFAVGTQGMIRPRVYAGAAYAEALSDDALVGALGHESEHVRTLDPLRYLVLELALSMNPLGRKLLEPHAIRWLAAREAHCDREAVLGGSLPLALAEAIVQAAKPIGTQAVALGASDTAMLRFRVGLLFAFSEEKPVRCCPRAVSAFPIGVFLLVLALLLPHETGTAALDTLHTSAEHAFIYLRH
jgi:hypothetical protein